MKRRPEVEKFADLMETVLRDNDWKGGWKDQETRYLLSRLVDEVGEFVEVFCRGGDGRVLRNMLRLVARELEHSTITEETVGEPRDPHRSGDVAGCAAVRREAADVANLAMMLVDVAGGGLV
jgi:NTP pyrophosphatase (non-canonical NTP hydrolase)